jgi:hypothetical protein
MKGVFGYTPQFVAATKENVAVWFRIQIRLPQFFQVFFPPKFWRQKQAPHFVACRTCGVAICGPKSTVPEALKKGTG